MKINEAISNDLYMKKLKEKMGLDKGVSKRRRSSRFKRNRKMIGERRR